MRKKASNLHTLHGTSRPDKAKIGPNFAPVSDTRPPKWLSTIAKAEWKRTLPLLIEAGTFTDADVTLLAAYCQSFAGWRDALAILAEHGQVVIVTSQTRTGSTKKPVRNPAIDIANTHLRNLVLTAAKLGFSPLDREKISAPSESIPDDDVRRGVGDIGDNELFDVSRYTNWHPEKEAR